MNVRRCLTVASLAGISAFLSAAHAEQGVVPIEFPSTLSDGDACAMFGLSETQLHELQSRLHLTNVQLLRMGPHMVAKSLDRLTMPEADEPEEAMEWRFRQRAGADGTIPRDAILIAKAQRDALIANNAVIEGAGPQWEWLGPGNIGGRTRSILINPDNPDVMYAGSVGGGVWKTTTGGSDWTPLTDFIASIAIGCMAMDPNDPDTIYVGTGEGFFNSDAIPGAGIFRTIDGGATFTQIQATNTANFEFVNRIAFAPGSSTTMLVATNNGIFRSTNAGQSFTQVNATRTLDVEYSPIDSMRAVAGQGNNAAWSNDGGVTWNVAAGGAGGGRVEVAMAPSNPATVYASVQDFGVFRSVDHGQTYALIGSQFYMGDQGWYDNAIWIDPMDSETVIVGGIDLWRTRDAGGDWTQMSMWQFAPDSAHADHHYIIEHPQFNGTTNRVVYFANDGGLYRTNNVYSAVDTNGWQSLNNNYGVTQFYGGGGNPLGFGTLVGGTQDNGTIVYRGSTAQWIRMFGGDGGFAQADQNQLQFLYGETQWARVNRSDDVGDTAASIYFPSLTDANPGTTNFISPIRLDPNGNNRLYVGCSRLWRTNNARTETGDGWTVVHEDVGSNHSAIAIAQGNPDLIWVGHGNGDVYRTLNGTSANPIWQRMDQNAPGLPNRFVTSIAIEPDDHNRVWVTFSGFVDNNVRFSDDGGATWQIRSGSPAAHLPALPVNSVCVDPEVDQRIFVGTDLGVFVSEDDGMTWTTDNVGPANTVVDELFFNTMAGMKYVIAVTHGRGMYRLSLSETFTTPADLNEDGVVNGSDLAILLAGWGGPFGDVNGDGITNGQDLAALLASWG